MRYRDQWRQIAQPAFATLLLKSSFNFYRSNLDSWDAGLSIISDKSNNGILSNNSIALQASYSRVLSQSRRNKNIIRFGGSLRYISTNINSNNLWFGRQFDLEALRVNTELPSGESPNNFGHNLISLALGSSVELTINKNLDLNIYLGGHHLNNPNWQNSSNEQSLSPRIFFATELLVHSSSKLQHLINLSLNHQGDFRQIRPLYLSKFQLNTDEPSKLILGVGSNLANSKNNSFSINSWALVFGIESHAWSALIQYEIGTGTLAQELNTNNTLELGLNYYFADN